MTIAAQAPAPTPTPAPTPHSFARVFSSSDHFAHFSQKLADQTSAWLEDNLLRILIAAAAAVVLVLALMGVRKALQRLDGNDGELRGWRTIIARMAEKTRFWFLVILTLRLVCNYAEAPMILDRTIGFFFTIGFTFQAATWARELTLGFIEHRAGADPANARALGSAMGIIRALVSFGLFAIALLLVLGNLGVNVTGLVAGLGVGGIAIGLAAQGVFADLFAAISILFDRPFRVGDMINYDNNLGTVEGIGMRSTRLRAVTGETRIISNKNLLDKEIQNVTGREHIRLQFMLSITYETPPDTLARIPDLLREMGEAEGAQVARAGFENFAASSLDFAFIIDVPGNDWSVAHPLRDRLLVRIMKRFAAEGIAMAYPTQTSYTAAPDGRLVMPYPQSAAGIP